MAISSTHADISHIATQFVPYIFHSKSFSLDFDDETNAVVEFARTAVIDISTKLTYEKLREDVLRVATGLLDDGVKPGDRILVVMEPSVKYVTFVLAAMLIGGVVVLADNKMDLEAVAVETKTTYSVVVGEYLNKITCITKVKFKKIFVVGAGTGASVVLVDHLYDYGGLPADYRLDINTATSLAMIVMKREGVKYVGVSLTHACLVANVVQLCDVDTEATASDVVLAAASVTSSCFYTAVLGVCFRAGCAAVLPCPTGKITNVVSSNSVTRIFMDCTLADDVSKAIKLDKTKQFKTVKAYVITHDVKSDFDKSVKMTKCCCAPECFISYAAPSFAVASSCGKLLPSTSIRLVNGGVDGTEGVLHVKGPQLCLGYTSGTFSKTKDGYFKTDINAKIDEHGNLFILASLPTLAPVVAPKIITKAAPVTPAQPPACTIPDGPVVTVTNAADGARVSLVCSVDCADKSIAAQFANKMLFVIEVEQAGSWTTLETSMRLDSPASDRSTSATYSCKLKPNVTSVRSYCYVGEAEAASIVGIVTQEYLGNLVSPYSRNVPVGNVAAQAVPLSLGPPDKPVVVAKSGTCLHVRFKTTKPNAEYIVQYKLTAAGQASDWYEAFRSKTKTECDIIDLQCNTPYAVRIGYVSDNVASDWSQIVMIKTGSGVPPQPGKPSIEGITATSFTVTWKPESDYKYQVEMVDGSWYSANKKASERDWPWKAVGQQLPAGSNSLALDDIGPNAVVPVRVIAYNNEGGSEPSKPAFGKTMDGLPPTPGTPQVSLVAPTWISVTWKPGIRRSGDDEVETFRVQLAVNIPGGSPAWRIIESEITHEGKNYSCKILELEPGQSYIIRVLAVNSFGESDPSKSIVAQTIGRPNVPDKPSAKEIQCTSFLLTWVPPRGSLEDEIRSKILSYTVFFQGPNDTAARKLTTTKENQLVIEQLEPSTQYHCSITCTNPQGESDMSPLLSVTTASGLPLAPEAPNVILELPKSLEMTFVPPYSFFPITEYLVEHDMGGSAKDYVRWEKVSVVSAGDNLMKVTLNGLEVGTSYRVRVAAMNKYGAGSFSKYGKGQTEGVPVAPERIVADAVTPVSIQLSWLPPKTPLPKGRVAADIAPVSYILYMQDSTKTGGRAGGGIHSYEGFRELMRTNDCSALIENLTHDTQYGFAVSAVNPQGEGALCKTLSVRTENGCPAPPASIIVDRATAHSVYISWKPVDCHQSGGPVEYIVEMSLLGVAEGSSASGKKSPFMVVVATAATDVCITDLDPGCIYTFRVSGKNLHGTGKPCKACGVCTIGSPMVPTDVKVSEISTQSMKLSWTAPTVVGYFPAENPLWSSATDPTNYIVEVSTDSGKTWQVIATVTQGQEELLLQNLSHNTSYILRVKAFNSQGSSPESKCVTAVTPNGCPPCVDKLKASSDIPHSALLTWTEPKEPCIYPSTTGAVDAVVQKVEITTTLDCDDSSTNFTEIPAVIKVEERKATATISNLTPNTTYKIRIQLVNSYGGTPCKSTTFTTPTGLPSVPDQTTVTRIQPTSLTVEWTEGAGLFGQDPEAPVTYRVEYSQREKIWIPVNGTYTVIEGKKKKKNEGNSYSMTVPALSPKSLYSLRVISLNKYGESSPSKPTTAETSTGIPSRPTNVIVGEVTDVSMQFLWIEGSLIKDQDAAVEIGYKFETTLVKTDLDEMYASRATDALMSKKTKKEVDKLDKKIVPATPTALSLSYDIKPATEQQIELYFKDVKTTNKIFSGIITGVVPLKMYDVKIAAINVFGTSPFTEAYQVRTFGPPMPPTLPALDDPTRTTVHVVCVMPVPIECGAMFVEEGGKYKEIKRKPSDEVISPLVEIMEIDETNINAVDSQSLQGQSSLPTETETAWYVPRGGTAKEIDPRKDKKDRVIPNEYETTIGGLKPQSVYRLRVRASNKFGVSPPSPAVVVKTLDVRPKVSSVSATEMRLTWSGAVLDGTVVVQYKKATESEYKSVPADEPSKEERKKLQQDKSFTATIPGLEAGVAYDVRLQNNSDAVSEAIRVETRAKAGIKCIEAPEAKYSNDEVKLVWSTRPEVDDSATETETIKDWIVQDDQCSGGQLWMPVGKIDADMLANKKHLNTLVLDILSGKATVTQAGQIIRAKDGETLGNGGIVMKEISVGKKKASAVLALAGWAGSRMFRVVPVMSNGEQGASSLAVAVQGRLNANIKM